MIKKKQKRFKQLQELHTEGVPQLSLQNQPQPAAVHVGAAQEDGGIHRTRNLPSRPLPRGRQRGELSGVEDHHPGRTEVLFSL